MGQKFNSEQDLWTLHYQDGERGPCENCLDVELPSSLRHSKSIIRFRHQGFFVQESDQEEKSNQQERFERSRLLGYQQEQHNV